MTANEEVREEGVACALVFSVSLEGDGSEEEALAGHFEIFEAQGGKAGVEFALILGRRA